MNAAESPSQTLEPELPSEGAIGPASRSIVDQALSLEAFAQLSGNLAGYPFVKVVVDRPNASIHFLNNALYRFHADYIAEALLGLTLAQLERDIDSYNRDFYNDPSRRFYLGILALHRRDERKLFSLETVEVDTMDREMLRWFYRFVKERVDTSVPLLLKPANHHQEAHLVQIDPQEVPRIHAHELFASARFVPLNAGVSQGRVRAFVNHEEYSRLRSTIEWYDIVVMRRVPDDIPRVAGIINAEHTTPLSHTNVLATGWKIPNSIQIGVLDRIAAEGLDARWVEYSVKLDAIEAGLRRIERPIEADQAPSWRATKIQLEEPEITHVPIVLLDRLRASDRSRYGTKAANLGELHYLLENGSERLLGFYRIHRPPRANLLPYLASALGVPEKSDLPEAASDFLRKLIRLPRGIAIPFSIQQEFLESSSKIQQAIGKLKMALELDAREVDSLCVSLQGMIVSARMPRGLRDHIDSQIARHLGGVSSFVVRSSSNAEDLESFSAAGIYESINHVTTADKIFESIKQVWASVLSPRAVHLRQEVGISLDDTYMGVIVQEEIRSQMGGVLVTTNPANRGDFRNVYLNISPRSVIQIVQGTELPLQYLYNTVEGGGRTLSLGSTKEDLPEDRKALLQKLALAGRLLQSHFSPDYTFSRPVDIEWLATEEGIYILQLRPYAK